ncbi:hypothetical protein [Rhodopila sp.]|uniref:hypothetical protein n=1 Tax=Rhodopila sp. TaxID=2480087 RepID=UPI003D0ECE6D
MLTLAVYLLSIAAVAGLILVLWHLRATETASRPPLIVGIAHGIVGAAGLAALLLALRGPPRDVAMGAGSFGTTAAWLLAAAVATGVALLVLRRKGPAVMMTIHAGVAFTGYVLFLAWSALG